MNPAKRNKIDLDKLTEEERKAFRMYGRLPTGKDVLSHKLKERKYFDSGDYALSKAGKTSGPVGVQHPSPETIPHSNAIAATTHSSSPVKESSLVHEAEIGEKTDTQAVRDAETGEKVNAQAKAEIGEKADTQVADANTQSKVTSTSTLNQTTLAPEPETPEQKQNSTTTSSSTETPPTSDS